MKYKLTANGSTAALNFSGACDIYFSGVFAGAKIAIETSPPAGDATWRAIGESIGEASEITAATMAQIQRIGRCRLRFTLSEADATTDVDVEVVNWADLG